MASSTATSLFLAEAQDFGMKSLFRTFIHCLQVVVIRSVIDCSGFQFTPSSMGHTTESSGTESGEDGVPFEGNLVHYCDCSELIFILFDLITWITNFLFKWGKTFPSVFFTSFLWTEESKDFIFDFGTATIQTIPPANRHTEAYNEHRALTEFLLGDSRNLSLRVLFLLLPPSLASLGQFLRNDNSMSRFTATNVVDELLSNRLRFKLSRKTQVSMERSWFWYRGSDILFDSVQSAD